MFTQKSVQHEMTETLSASLNLYKSSLFFFLHRIYPPKTAPRSSAPLLQSLFHFLSPGLVLLPLLTQDSIFPKSEDNPGQSKGEDINPFKPSTAKNGNFFQKMTDSDTFSKINVINNTANWFPFFLNPIFIKISECRCSWSPNSPHWPYFLWPNRRHDSFLHLLMFHYFTKNTKIWFHRWNPPIINGLTGFQTLGSAPSCHTLLHCSKKILCFITYKI